MEQLSLAEFRDCMKKASGSTWVPVEKIPGGAEALQDLISRKKVTLCSHNRSYHQVATLTSVAKAEAEVARNMIRLARVQHRAPSVTTINGWTDRYEKKLGGMHYAPEQRNAIIKGVQNMLLVLIGGPGTGKTTVVKGIVNALRHDGCKDILFLAPTGKAAKRLRESIGPEFCSGTSTIHKALGLWEGHMDTPKQITSQAVVVDEVSMMDLATAKALLRAIPVGTRLILIGDTDQLASVGIGAILRDAIASNVIPVAKLIKTFRQGNESGIFKNMKKIRIGNSSLTSTEDFRIACPDEQYSAQRIMLTLYLASLKKYKRCEDVIILTPMRKKGCETSCETLNPIIQRAVNPTGDALVTNTGKVFRVGDPVIQLCNKEQVANGDTGKVIAASDEKILVRFQDCTITYTRDSLDGECPELALCYAMTIHKSQGSEYKCVITSMLDTEAVMAQRNLLYTAVTRAKKECFLVCDPDTVKKACETETASLRVTMLSEYLRYYAFVY